MSTLLQVVRKRLWNHQTARAHTWQSLANYVQQGFGLLFGILLARLLFPSDFGAFGLAAASVSLALLPANWSLTPSLLADAGRTPSLYRTVISFAWCVVLARLAIVAAVVLWLLYTATPQIAALSCLIGLTESFRELNSVQRTYLEAQGNFKPNAISAISSVVFCLGIVVPIARLGWGPLTLALPGLGSLGIDFLLFRYYSGKSIFVRPSWTLSPELFRSGFWIWLNGTAELALMRLDSWFVGKSAGVVDLGYYNRAFGYAPISHLALNSLLANPTVVSLSRCETAAQRRRLLRFTALIVFTGGFLNWLALFFFSKQIVLFVFGPKWIGAIPLFEAFASFSLVYAFAYLPITLMSSQRLYRKLALIRGFSVAIFAITLLLAPGAWSAISVAWLVQATWLLQGCLLFFSSRSLLIDP